MKIRKLKDGERMYLHKGSLNTFRRLQTFNLYLDISKHQTLVFDNNRGVRIHNNDSDIEILADEVQTVYVIERVNK